MAGTFGTCLGRQPPGFLLELAPANLSQRGERGGPDACWESQSEDRIGPCDVETVPMSPHPNRFTISAGDSAAVGFVRAGDRGSDCHRCPRPLEGRNLLRSRLNGEAERTPADGRESQEVQATKRAFLRRSSFVSGGARSGRQAEAGQADSAGSGMRGDRPRQSGVDRASIAAQAPMAMISLARVKLEKVPMLAGR